ncbi:unnamed protein product [Penicillium glandicola]
MPRPRKRKNGLERGQKLLVFQPILNVSTSSEQVTESPVPPGTHRQIQVGQSMALLESQSTGNHLSPPTSQSLAPRQYSRFESGICHVVRHLRSAPECQLWETIFPHCSDERIVKFIMEYTVDSMKQLVDREAPPTFKELQSLRWYDTKEFGVYGKLLESPDNFQNNFVYVGSATSSDNGLRHRKKTHLNDVNQKSTAYRRKSTYVDVRSIFAFATRESGDKKACKALSGALRRSKVAFTTLLGAYEEGGPDDLEHYRNACPYGRPVDVFDYQGACTHSAFREKTKLLDGQKPQTALKGNSEEPQYNMSCREHGMGQIVTYDLQPVVPRRGDIHILDKFLDDGILDVELILGIECDKPILSSIPQRRVSTEVPEGPKKRKRKTAPMTEANKAKHREEARKYCQRPEIKQKHKERYWQKKNTSTEEEKAKAREWHNHTVKKKKDAVHLAVHGTPRRQPRPPTELVLADRAKAQAKQAADQHSKIRASHANRVSKAQKKVNQRRCAKFHCTTAQIEEAWLGLWERQIARFDWQLSIRQTRIVHTPTVEQRQAVSDWIANGRRETPATAVNVLNWDELRQVTG